MKNFYANVGNKEEWTRGKNSESKSMFKNRSAQQANRRNAFLS